MSFLDDDNEDENPFVQDPFQEDEDAIDVADAKFEPLPDVFGSEELNAIEKALAQSLAHDRPQEVPSRPKATKAESMAKPTSRELGELEHMMQHLEILEEIPEYKGPLEEEFHMFVGLYALGCMAMVGFRKPLAGLVQRTSRKSWKLINKFYTALRGHSAPQFTLKDMELVRLRAVNLVPLDQVTMEYTVTPKTLDKYCRGTSNVCHEVLYKLQYDLNDKRPSQKETRDIYHQRFKTLLKLNLKLQATIKRLTDGLDKEQEDRHKYMNKQEIDVADLTEYEKALCVRKRKAR